MATTIFEVFELELINVEPELEKTPNEIDFIAVQYVELYKLQTNMDYRANRWQQNQKQSTASLCEIS